MKTRTTKEAKTIARWNDLFRNEPENYGHMGLRVLTQGVYGLDIMEQLMIMDRVQMFEDFNPDNDPHGQHDFGAFGYCGHKVFWKIDYYNEEMTGGSPDPSDWQSTTRVLTTMLASEY